MLPSQMSNIENVGTKESSGNQASLYKDIFELKRMTQCLAQNSFFLVISDFSDNPDVPHACLMSLFMISKQRYNFYEIKSITVADLGGTQEA